MRKKLYQTMAFGVLGMSLIFQTPSIQAQAGAIAAEQTVTPTYINSLQEQASVSTFTSQLKFNFTAKEEDTDKYQDLKLTVDKESLVRIGVSATEGNSGMSWGDISVYDDALKSNQILKFSYSMGTASPTTKQDYLHLYPGTYYIRVSATRNATTNGIHTIATNVIITATEVSKIFGATSQSTANGYTILFQKPEELTSDIRVYDKSVNTDTTDYSYTQYSASDSACSVNKPGTYTVIYTIKSSAGAGKYQKFAIQLKVGEKLTKTTSAKPAAKKSLKVKLSAKRGAKKVTVTSVKKASVKVKIGKKTYKGKTNAKGKATVKTCKLKKKMSVKVTISKSGYKTTTKTIKIK